MLEKPMVIFGIGRTGSTFFHRVLCEHPHVAWLTDLADRFPTHPWINGALMRLVDLPGIGRLANRVYPSECYTFLEHHCPGFRRPCRDLVAGDLSERSKTRLQQCLQPVVTASRSRLSLKITGWPRLAFLAACFPEARFVHLVRDGRAVANSFLNVSWWEGWQGPSNWRWGLLTEEQEEEWLRHDRSFVALAGIQWKLYMEAVAAAKDAVGADRVMDVRFEDYCQDPEATMRAVLKFVALEEVDIFWDRFRQFPVKDVSSKWKRDLSRSQRAILESVLGDALAEHGYPKA